MIFFCFTSSFLSFSCTFLFSRPKPLDHTAWSTILSILLSGFPRPGPERPLVSPSPLGDTHFALAPRRKWHGRHWHHNRRRIRAQESWQLTRRSATLSSPQPRLSHWCVVAVTRSPTPAASGRCSHAVVTPSHFPVPIGHQSLQSSSAYKRVHPELTSRSQPLSSLPPPPPKRSREGHANAIFGHRAFVIIFAAR